MYIKKGFTLAEILITLSIVGIAAALTVPALVKNSSQAKIGPSLAKFVNTFENATEAVLYDLNTTVLSDGLNTIETSLLPAMTSHMTMTPASGSLSYKAASGDTSDTCESSLYLMKNNALVCMEDADSGAKNKSGGSYKGIKANVFYDINGTAGPNRAGIDIFKFYLDDAGSLIPYGSAAMQSIYSDGKKGSSCSTTKRSSDIDTSFACTGRYADDGWKS